MTSPPSPPSPPSLSGPSDPQVATRLAAALEIARGAGDVGLHYFRSQRFDVQTKSDGSPVTIADRESEQTIRHAIERAFPDDAILGEEFPEQPGASGFRWVIDPIDGTAAFIHGVPLYGVLIGVEVDGRSVAGVIHLPALAETAYAARGGGAWHVTGRNDPRRARVSTTARLADACVCTTSYEYFAKAGRERLMLDLGGACKRMRGWNDCYAHLLVATGRVDAVVDPVMNPWDSAASIVVIEEAGGRYTGFNNVPSAHEKNALITNSLIHDELLRLVALR